MNALLFGASGGLAQALAHALLARKWQLDLITRQAKLDQLTRTFRDAIHQQRARLFAVERSYASFLPSQPAHATFFTQALFTPSPLISMPESAIAEQLQTGLTDLIQLTRTLLIHHPPSPTERRDYCYIGSTSAYSGFRDTSVYCAVKHGLLGFVRAMNDEYAQSNTRFWLFSMGTMDTEMGRRLTEQDPSSFLNPNEVAARIVAAIAAQTNAFEPEVILRRRTVRFLDKAPGL